MSGVSQVYHATPSVIQETETPQRATTAQTSGLPPRAIAGASAQCAARQTDAGRLPPPARRATPPDFAEQMHTLNALRPQVGEAAYCATRTALLHSEVAAGRMDAGTALREIRNMQLQLQLPEAPEKGNERADYLQALQQLAYSEKALIMLPLAKAADHAHSQDLAALSNQLATQIDSLLAEDSTAEDCRAAAQSIRDLAPEALRLAGLEHPGADNELVLATNIMNSLEYAAQVADEKASLCQSIENITEVAFNQEAYLEAVTGVAHAETPEEAIAAFNACLEALNRTEAKISSDSGATIADVREAVINLGTKLSLTPSADDADRTDACLRDNDPFSRSMRDAAREAQDQLATNRGEREKLVAHFRPQCEEQAVALLESVNPRPVGGRHPDPAATAEDGHKAVDDLAAQAALVGMDPESYTDLHVVVDKAASFAAARQDWDSAKGSEMSTDKLARIKEEAEVSLAELKDKPSPLAAERLANHISAFNNFLTERCEQVSQFATDVLQETQKFDKADDAGLDAMLLRIDWAMNEMGKAPRLGDTLKTQLADQLSARRDELFLARLTLGLERAVDKPGGSLASMQEHVDALPPGPGKEAAQNKLKEFSDTQLKRIKKDLEKLTVDIQEDKARLPNTIAAVQAELQRLERSAENLLTAEDKQVALESCETSRQSALGKLTDMVIQSLKTEFLERAGIAGANDEQSRERAKGLRFLLSNSFVSPLVLERLGGAKPEALQDLLQHAGQIAAARERGETPPQAAADKVLASLDALCRGLSVMDEAVLEIKLACNKGLEAPELTTAKHISSRSKDALFQSMSAHAPELLEFKGITSSDDLTLEVLQELAASMEEAELSPFDVLLMQTMWNAFRTSGKELLSDDDAAMDAFRKKLPGSLATQSNDVIRGMFKLGVTSRSELADARYWIDQVKSFASAPDLRRLMDRFSATDPKFRLHRALTIEARNLLIATGNREDLNNKPLSQLMKLVGQAYKDGAARASLGDRILDKKRRLLGHAAKDLSRTRPKEQLRNAARHFAASEGTYKNLEHQVQKLEEGIAYVQASMIAAPGLSAEKARSSSGTSIKKEFKHQFKNAPESYARVRAEQLADPMDFLYRQGAVTNGDPPAINPAAVQGETISVTILAFHDLLSGLVSDLPMPAQNARQAKAVVKALQAFKLPENFYLEQMRTRRGISLSSDAEGKKILQLMRKIQDINLDKQDAVTELNDLANALTNAIRQYKLVDKAKIILAYKVPGKSTALRSTPLSKNKTVQASPAFDLGMYKATGMEKTLPADAEALCTHMRKTYVVKRGMGINQGTMVEMASLEKKQQLSRQQALLRKTTDHIDSHNLRSLRRLGNIAIMAALTDLKTTNYTDVMKGVQRDKQNSELYKNAHKLLTDMEIPAEVADLLLQRALVLPSMKASDSPEEVLNKIVEKTKPSPDLIADYRKTSRSMTSTERLAQDAKVTAEICRRMVNQLAPGSAMSVDLTNAFSLSVSGNVGAATAGVAVELAAQTGFAVSRQEDGTYQVAVCKGVSGGIGLSVGVDAVVGDMEANLGASLEGSKGIEFSFAGKAECIAFMSNIFSGTWSPNDAATLCSKIASYSSIEVGASASVSIELGSLKVANTEIVAFSAGFEADVHHERKTTTNPANQSVTVEKASSGQITLSCSAGKAESSEEPKTEQERQDALDKKLQGHESSAKEIVHTAGGGVTGVNMTPVGDLGVVASVGDSASVSVGASIGKEGVTLAARFSASCRSSLTRSTQSDQHIINATTGTRVDFSGPNGVAALWEYLITQCNLQPKVADKIVNKFTSMKSEPQKEFALLTEYALKPGVLAECQTLEIDIANKTKDLKASIASSDTAGSLQDEIKVLQGKVTALLNDRNNYTLNEIQISGASREEKRELHIIAYSRSVNAKQEQTLTFTNENNALETTPTAA